MPHQKEVRWRTFFTAVSSVSVEEETLNVSDALSEADFQALIGYLGSSPRMGDAVAVSEMLQGNAAPLIMGLGAHLLVASGGTAGSMLRVYGSRIEA